MKVKTQKLDDIQFSIQDGEVGLSLEWKSGELFLSMRGIVIRDGATWYEVPVRDLIDVYILKDEPNKITLNLQSARVLIAGENAEFLQALRHFLLPYVSVQDFTSAMGSFLKLWALGLREIEAFSKVLNLGPEVIDALMEQAQREELITNGRLTSGALRHLSQDDSEFLKKLEAFND